MFNLSGIVIFFKCYNKKEAFYLANPELLVNKNTFGPAIRSTNDIFKFMDNLANSKISFDTLLETLFDEKPLGTAFCSVINSTTDILKFRNKIVDNIEYYITEDSVEDNIKNIFSSVLDINQYYIFAHNLFVLCYEKIIKDLKNNDKNKYDVYKQHIDQTFYKIVTDMQFQLRGIVNGFIDSYVPEAMVKLNSDRKSVTYAYQVKQFDIFLKASYYQIINNYLHLKPCIYPNCNKLFITPYGQTKYCDNPCPDNPNYTCRNVPRNFNRNEDVQSPIEREVDNLGDILKRLREQYRYYANIQTQKRKKEMIINNAETLKNVSADLRRKIKSNSSELQAKYLKIYKNFLDEVESNLKSSPKVFKIKKPKY